MTLEEKKNRILKFMQDEYSFYNMKELEKLIPKKCAGVSSMLVKDLVQQMIDEDGLVCVEKCGNINVYWCFKNQITQKVYDSCQRLQAQIVEKEREVSDLKEKFKIANDMDRSEEILGDNGTVEYSRQERLKVNHGLEEEIKRLQSEYSKLTQTRWNKEKIAAKLLVIQKESAKLETITDNIELIIEFLCSKYNIDSKSLRKELEIPEEFRKIEI